MSEYEFADARIVRAVYRGGDDLLGRDMLLEGRFCGLRFYLGVRVTGMIDETRDTAGWRHLIARTPQPLNDAVRFADSRLLCRISGSILGS